MDPVKIVVKQESDRDLCNGCLSHNRVLKPFLDQSEICTHFFGSHYTELDQKYILLCWECGSLMKRICKFRDQVHFASSVLQARLYQQFPPPLSTLSIKGLDSYSVGGPNPPYDKNLITYQSNETLPTVPPEISVSRVVTKIENEEDDEDDFNYDMPLSEFIEPKLEAGIEEKIKKKVKKKHKLKIEIDPKTMKFKKGPRIGSRKFRTRAKMTKNPEVNLTDYSQNFTTSLLTEEEILKLGQKLTKSSSRHDRKDRRPKCVICNLAFPSGLDQRRHITFCHTLKEQSKPPYKCLECEAKCEDLASLRAHWADHNATWRCKLCAARVAHTFEFKMHSRTHKYLLTCLDCDLPGISVTFNNNRDFGYHFKTLHRRAVCDACRREFLSTRALEKHIRKTHMERYCRVCDRWFDKYLLLQRHYVSMHPELANRVESKEERYCVECDKQFASAERYRRHLAATAAHNPDAVRARRERGKRPCPACGKMFRRNSVMRAHYKLFHENKTDHYCQLCDKYLVSAYRLRTHVQGVHLKMRDPKDKLCGICGRAFASNTVLKKHIRTHTGERPYKCTLCPAAFTQRTPLKSHLKTQHHATC